MHPSDQLHGGCSCQKVSFNLAGPVLFRALCHCTICQRFNAAPYGDVVAVRARDVTLEGAENIAYRSHRQPPIVSRGRCASCDGVAIERLNLPLLPQIYLLPVQVFADAAVLPDPDFHIFYDKRQQDHGDSLPKSSGYMPSELRFTAALLGSLLKR